MTVLYLGTLIFSLIVLSGISYVAGYWSWRWSWHKRFGTGANDKTIPSRPPLIPDRAWRAEWLQGFSTEMAGALVTTVFLTTIFTLVQNTESTNTQKAELILEIGSPNNAVTIEAIRQLRARGWLGDGSLDGSSLSGANLSNAPLQKSKMERVDLSCTLLPCTILDGTDFTEANLTQVDFTGLTLIGTVFTDAILTEAKFNKTVLDAVNFEGANLTKATLREIIVDETSLRGANLTNADLTGINLRDAILTNTNLSGANLTDAILQGADIAQTTFSVDTILPDGTKWSSSTVMTIYTNP